MTCIVGLIHEGKIYIGGDSAGVGGYELQTRRDTKVFVLGEFVIGFTSSYRMGQLLRYAFQPPRRHADADVMRFMVVDFVDALRACMKNGGVARKDNEVESLGVFLVGYQGRLFRIEGDYQVGETVDEFNACGCGEAYAKGCLHSDTTADPGQKVRNALLCAERFSAGVRGPFEVVSR